LPSGKYLNMSIKTEKLSPEIRNNPAKLGNVSIAEAIKVTGAEKVEFESSFKADCCGSIIQKGNAFYAIYSGGEESEIEDECCTRCLKKVAYYKQHQYDNFNPDDYPK
jgi:hypothetical protein